MPKKYLITGCSGFLGFHLAHFLVQQGHQVLGTYLTKEIAVRGVEPLRCDFKDRTSVREVIKRSQPDTLFHLGGQSNIQASWKDFEGTFQTNVFGTYYLLEAILENQIKSKVLVAGSSSSYGSLRPEEDLLRESGPLRPTNPYALSKIGEELLGRMYHEAFGLPVVGVIPFYVLGPGKEPDAPSDFAKAILGHKRGKVDQVTVGDLDVVRDVVDVRDAVRALCLLEEKGQTGISYNLCTGKGTRLRDVLNAMIKISHSSIPVIEDTAKLRKGENQRIVGDPARLKSLGWQPTVSLSDSLRSILDYWEKTPEKLTCASR